jgi:hypothetical protein
MAQAIVAPDTIYTWTFQNGVLGNVVAPVDGTSALVTTDQGGVETANLPAGSITGGFSYDVTEGVLTALSITTTAGPTSAGSADPTMPGATYSMTYADTLDVLDNVGEFDFYSDQMTGGVPKFELSLFLTDDSFGNVEGMTYPLNADTILEQNNPSASDFREGLSGTLQIAAAPEPASLSLLGLGMLGLAVIRRRRRT